MTRVITVIETDQNKIIEVKTYGSVKAVLDEYLISKNNIYPALSNNDKYTQGTLHIFRTELKRKKQLDKK